jgi:hypothetical protein
MSRPHRIHANPPPPGSGGGATTAILPVLATAEEIAKPLQVTARTIHLWGAAGTIPVALRQGRTVRYSPSAVAQALGIDV